MNSTRNMGLAPGVCPLCRHDPCDCATVAPPLDLGQFEGYTEGDWKAHEKKLEFPIRTSSDLFEYAIHDENDKFIALCCGNATKETSHLIAHAPAILDRARELEAEVIALKLQLAVDVMTLAPLQSQRDELAGAVKYLLPRDDIRGGPNSECRCCGTRYLSSDAIKQHYKCNEPSCERAQARAALARVQGDEDKEGGG